MHILLADDHVLFRESLKVYLEILDSDIKIRTVGGFSEVMDNLNNPEQNNLYDLIMLDLRMPGMFGLKSVQENLDQFLRIPTVILSGVATEKDVKQALDMGLMGFMPKTLGGDSLLNALRLVINGERYIPSDGGKDITFNPSIIDFIDKPDEDEHDTNFTTGTSLTSREKDVLHYLVVGNKNQEIADQLGIKLSTVKLYVHRLCQKLDARNRTEIIHNARQQGLLK